MKTIIEYLDELNSKLGSDYACAKALNISRVSVGQIRKRGSMGDETAIKIADLLGVDRGEVLLAAAMARSEGEALSAWGALAKRLSHAAGVVMVIGLSLNGGEIKAVGLGKNCQEYTLCVFIVYPLAN